MVASSPHVEEHQWFAIVNPVAGNGRGLDEFPRISKLLREQQIHCEAVFSEHKFHAVELTVEAVRRTPVENLFAETDESDVPIEEIYRRIAQAKDLDPELLKCAIYRNYREIFER